MTDATDLTAWARGLLDGTTPGPWGWTVNRQSKTVELSGRGGDLTVMSFARWGMSSAAPVFWFWRGNVSDEPKRADALAYPAPGRDHHKHWFAQIDHPDARLMESAPDLARALIASEARNRDLAAQIVDAEKLATERLQELIAEVAARKLAEERLAKIVNVVRPFTDVAELFDNEVEGVGAMDTLSLWLNGDDEEPAWRAMDFTLGAFGLLSAVIKEITK